MSLPTISNYGHYSTDNYGVHTLIVRLGTITLRYSYKTIVAYMDAEDGVVICENIWGTTTGKHINWINRDKSIRKDRDTFLSMLEAALERHIR